MSQLALDKIRYAKATNATYLDLGHCGLHGWPDELFELTQLETLILSNRHWDAKNREWIHSENHGALNLLKDIPHKITSLQNLSKVIISGSPDKHWQISDLQPLVSLPRLHHLACSFNQIKNIEALALLSNLTILDLRTNEITDIQVLAQLAHLTILDLSSNAISDIQALERLSQLTHLKLFNNQINDHQVQVLKQLSNLVQLDLSYNLISDIQVLAQMPELTHLNVNSNQISDIQVLAHLSELIHLNLNSNEIKSIQVLAVLSKLTQLDLHNNDQISDFQTLTQLPGLTRLDLSGNQMTNIQVVGQLPELTQLNLYNNQINNIQVLAQLPKLTLLDLSYNQISDIQVLSELPKLIQLDLGGNQITDIQVLAQLPKLTQLNLDFCKISNIQVLAQLDNLTQLNLSYNQISDIQALQKFLQNGLEIRLEGYSKPESITLKDNPITNPPLEIVQQGREAVLNYFESLEDGEETVHEAKLLILGEAGAGKTTLARKLQNPDAQMPDEITDTTTGIDITPYIFEAHGAFENFTMNIWDFGGQEIYHATHQFFLSTRSLYVLLADGRKEENLDYWLQVQELLGGDSPLLLVLNQKGTIRQDIALNELRGQYPNLKDLAQVDLKNNRDRIIRLNAEVEHHIRNLPHLVKGEKLPKAWVQVRAALQEKSELYISIQAFRKICREAGGISDAKKQNFLSSYLHDLGVMLHFQEQALLRDTVILQPEWATDAVYSILDHTKRKATVAGHFTQEDLEAVWTDASYQDMFDKLLALMRNFELCYPVPSQPGLFIVPQLLSGDKPTGYLWDHYENIRVRYKYDFMPKGILTRLIVRLHEAIVDQHNRLWKRGVVFQNKDQDTFAQVLELPREKEIDIRIQGTHTRDLMTIILHEMDQINSTFKFNERMNVSCLFPCNCSDCLFTNSPNFYDYRVLRHYIARKRRTIECNKSFENVPIFDLIDRLANLPTMNDL